MDLPNTAESTDLLKRCLTALSHLFSDEQVKVDPSTGNASRIFKVYGTLARKGDNTPERPHRRAAILTAPASRQCVSREQLEALAALAPAGIKTSSAATRPVTANTPRHSGYAQAALESEVASVSAAQSGNRNNQLFKSAAALFSLVAAEALAEGEVWQALLSAAQGIGLSELEARRTIQSGADHGRNHPRLLPKASQPPPPSTETQELRQARPSTPLPPVTVLRSKASDAPSKPTPDLLMHVDDLDALPPIRWLIQDYLPEDSLVEVYGAPSAGKTQVVFDMAQTLAASGQTVVYVVAEGLRGYRNRKKAWQQFRKQEGGNLYLWREPVQLFEAPAVQQFINAIKPKEPVLVVFDTLSRCSLGADENNQKDMGFILESLDTVRRETGATVVAVHHTNAGGSRERGSTVIRGGMDIMLEVSKEDDLIALACAKVKDASEFETAFFKPVLVDIGEPAPVPVLVPADKRVQTQADKLSTLQLDILRAIGMEMFAKSGIKSSQLDEILPPGTKRASKYYSLNSLIRLGYVEPHEKGDPYLITEAGRLKLSNADSASVSVKSNLSKASPSPFLWTLPESCPMSSPIPHTCGCGMDETLDNSTTDQTTQTISLQNQVESIGATTAVESLSKVESRATSTEPLAVITPAAPEDCENRSTADETLTDNPLKSPPPMTEQDLQRYAAQVGVPYPTTDGTALYQIAAIIPRHLRAAFEAGLGGALAAYRAAVAAHGQEPAEHPIPDILALYLSLGFVSTEALYEGYQHACRMGHQMPFLNALRTRNSKAIEHLKAFMAGQRYREHMVIATLPKFGPGGNPGVSQATGTPFAK